MKNEPTLYLSELASLKLRYAADEIPNEEVSGFGRIEVDENGRLILADIIVPPQEVGGAHVEIDPEVRDAFYLEVKRNGCQGLDCERRQEDTQGRDVGWEALTPARARRLKCTAKWCGGKGRPVMFDPEDNDAFCADCYDRWIHLHNELCNNGDIKAWRVWWHKHPGKGKPSPSGVDRNTLDDFANPTGFGFGWMIGVIISADASNVFCWLDTYSGPWGLTLDDIDVKNYFIDNDPVREQIKQQMKGVRRKTWTQPSTPQPYSRAPNGQPYGRHWDAASGKYVNDDGSPTVPSVSNSTKPPHRRIVRVEKSRTYPGCIEVTRDDGTVYVTRGNEKDLEIGTEADPLNGKQPGERAPKKSRQTIMRHVREEGIHWVGLGVNRALRAREGTEIIGFSLNGEPLIAGEERHVYFELNEKMVAVVADPAIRHSFTGEDELPPVLTDLNFAVAKGLGADLIGFDKDGNPLKKGEEMHLYYDTEGVPFKDGEPAMRVVDKEAIAMDARQYLLPAGIEEEDAAAWMAMMGAF